MPLLFLDLEFLLPSLEVLLQLVQCLWHKFHIELELWSILVNDTLGAVRSSNHENLVRTSVVVSILGLILSLRSACQIESPFLTLSFFISAQDDFGFSDLNWCVNKQFLALDLVQ